MTKAFFTVIILCSAVFSVAAQILQNEKSNVRKTQDQNVSPIKWERYKSSDKNLSILLPKMPILIELIDVCAETESKHYAAYAEEVVYQMDVYSKSKMKATSLCGDAKVEFGQRTIEIKTRQLNIEIKEVSRFKINEKETIKFSVRSTTYWIINDLANDKFIVLAVTHRNDLKPDVERFIQSVDFKKKPDGIEIKEGAPQTLGDDLAKYKQTADKKDEVKADDRLEPLFLVVKPQARYTDAARENNIQGTVNLRVTFLAHGGIGSIAPVKELPYGLTEQAIIAAKKIVFLPQKRNGLDKSVTKMVQYGFSIY